MLTLSSDPKMAEHQMVGMIFYLTTFGYIDGDFDPSEKEFIRGYIRRLVEHRVDNAMPEATPALREEVVSKAYTHFNEVFEATDREIQDMWNEPVADGEESVDYVQTRLKTRCFELFRDFDRDSQEALMDTIDELLMADGFAHPAELKFRGELAEILHSDLEIDLEIEAELASIVDIGEPMRVDAGGRNHPLFTSLEHHYSSERHLIEKQLAADRALIKKTGEMLDAARDAGHGRLAGHKHVDEFAGQAPFLDQFVHVVPPTAPRGYELTVLGDLHGCYSCLKAAVMQSDFFAKVDAYERDPNRHPEPRLVLLGDYIDRGMFSYNGVLRTVMQLYCKASRYVHILRGNHEYYLEHQGEIYGGVRPAEAINTLKPHAPRDIFKDYLQLFDKLPTMLLFDKMLFVHGGIPRDSLIKERYKDLGSLNDPDIRFQMMWSDPSSADFIPPSLQEQSARFPFGRLQAQAFLQRLGCNTLIRGHEKIEEGFRRVYDDGRILLATLFSAGGEYNDDLPLFSSYRFVTPMALTIRWEAGDVAMRPWVIDYEVYNDPERNAFYKSRPQIEHKED